MEGNRTLWEESCWIVYLDTNFLIIFKENFITMKEKEGNYLGRMEHTMYKTGFFVSADVFIEKVCSLCRILLLSQFFSCCSFSINYGKIKMFFAVLCSDCILFVDDFTLSKVPSSNGRKFYISSPRLNTSASSARGSVSNLTSVGLEEKQRTTDRLRRLMKDLVLGETKPK